MTENGMLKIAIHCLGVQAEQEVCEECDIYGNCHTDCKDVAVVAIKALKEIQQYREIGTVEECREAVDRQKPKKPHRNYKKFSGLWCKCGWYLGQKQCLDIKYCTNCGQAIELMRIWRKWKMSEICCKGAGEPGTRCEYDDVWFCKNPDCKNPVLTSTMLGAYPSGCPKIYEWNRRRAGERCD